MLELIEQYWPIVVGIVGIVYGYTQRVSKKEFVDFMADIEDVTEDGNVSPEETINIIAKLIRIFKE
ncbi:hypothetical protein GQ473_04305 [archaeon]|nr:hypothetical protein [archaeon]